MTICFCNNELALGGAQRRLVQLIIGLHKNGYHDIHCILLEEKIVYKEVLQTDVKIHIIKKGRSKYSFYKQYKQLLSEIKPDIVHCWSMQQAFYLNLIAPFSNFKYVCGTITTANTYKKTVSYYYVEKLAFIISDVIVTNSNAGLIAKRAPKDKSVVIYNGYDYQRQNNIKDIQTIRKELDINTPYIISMASRIAPQKDIDMLVNTARILLNERDDITFLMIGDGPQLEYYQEYIKKNKILNLKFTGYRNDVESIINASTVCVLCSKHAEGVSNSIMESLAAGKPVIATRSGGTSEIIYDGENGYIVEPSDFHMMASKIKDIIDNRNLYNHLSKRAKEIINEKFLLSHMVEQYITMYNKLLNQ